MSSTSLDPFDPIASTLAGVTVALQAFVDAWEESDEPRLAEFLPEEGEERRLTLIELIKVDLEYRWNERSLPKRIAEYLAEFPELRERGVPLDLVYEEFHVRRNSGFQVDLDEYVEAFPDREEELRRLLATAGYESTSLRMPRQSALDELQPGETIEDFELLAKLGEGAFAKVFLARQTSMQRMVALKVSSESGEEPQTLAQFDHESIVRVYDLRSDDERQLRLLYMQYVPGGTLHDVVKAVRATDPGQRSGRLLVHCVDAALNARGESRDGDSATTRSLAAMSWPECVCWIGSRLARALDYAHTRGVLHCDIKPANVLVSRDGVPKLADFNVSIRSKVAGIASTEYFGGSLAYMSPEQLEACNPASPRKPDELDGRSDQFSLAVMLWELLTGSRPFRDEAVADGNWGSNVAALTERRRHGLPESARAAFPADAPPGLLSVLARCLECDPAQRWHDGTELARQLDVCRNADVQRLLHPPDSAWSAVVRRMPVTLVVLLAALPNGFAGVFNWFYNRREVVEQLGERQVEVFDRVQAIINAIAYPVGLGLLAFLAWTIVRAARELESGEVLPPERSRRLRRRCLDLGHLAAMIGLTEWTIAGLVYPAAIHAASGELSTNAYVHFLASLFLCGLIAAAYPFFAINALGVSRLYPRLLRERLPHDDVHPLEQLSRRSWFYLGTAVAVPLVSVLVLVLFRSQARYALVVLSGGSLIGFGLVAWCFRLLQRHLSTLIDAMTDDPDRRMDAS